MKSRQGIAALVAKTLAGLTEQAYSRNYIQKLQKFYCDLQQYMETRGTHDFVMELGLDYLRDTHGISVEGLYGLHPREMLFPMRALQILWDYAQNGFLVTKMKPANKPFECPSDYQEAYNTYLLWMIEKGNAPKTQTIMLYSLQRFIGFLTEYGVTQYDGITGEIIREYLSSFAGCQPSYIAVITRRLRYFLSFCYDRGYIQRDISKSILKTKTVRSRMLPSSWTEDEIRRTLECIDRASMTGKRDYAIILLVARLGLRAGDVRSLKISDIDWKAHRISIIMEKTTQVLSLPLLEDVGWALIDYLRNARPETESPHLFIRRTAPYTQFGNASTLTSMVGCYLNKAEIDVSGRRHGLHSFRNTLARVMLENGATLPIISEVLGHHNIQTTSIYLSIDIEGLKNCIVDPDEVFSHEV